MVGWLVGFLWHINLWRLFNAKSIFIQIFSSVSNNSVQHKHSFNVIIQFCISTQFSYIWPIDRTLSGATTMGQSWPGNDGNKEVLHILQRSRITGTSPSDCLVSYGGHWRGGDIPLQRCSRCILLPQLTGQYIYMCVCEAKCCHIYVYICKKLNGIIYMYL